MIKVLSIAKSIRNKLKDIAELKVYEEEVDKLTTPSFILDIIPVSTTKWDEIRRDRKFHVDITYCPKGKTNKELFAMLDLLEEKFGDVLEVEDRFFTIEEFIHFIQDKKLHYTFDLYFGDCMDKQVEESMMGDLTINEEWK